MRTRTRVLSVSVGILTVVLFACSGSSDGDGVSTSPDVACDDFAASFCGKYKECAPAFAVPFLYGDDATCQSRLKQDCLKVFSAPGSSTTTAQAQTCASDFRAQSCDALYGRQPTSCDTIPGTLADGAPCAIASQCKGTACKTPANGTCGVCATRAPASSPCESSSDCVEGLACAGGKCVTRGQAGAGCSESQPCEANLKCVDAKCAVGLKAGAACTRDKGDPCDTIAGLVCDPTSNVCKTFSFAAGGEPCGLLPGGALAICSAGGKCKVAAGTFAGTCLAAAADGAACGGDGPDCLSPARCVNGVCVRTDPAACK